MWQKKERQDGVRLTRQEVVGDRGGGCQLAGVECAEGPGLLDGLRPVDDHVHQTTLSIVVRLSPLAACVDRIGWWEAAGEFHQQQSSSLSPRHGLRTLVYDLSAESVSLADA